MNNIDLKPYTYEIKKSKFISYVFNINNKKEFNRYLSYLQYEHKKARHICYAYKFNDENNILNAKVYDDGEPKGTAGYPIFSIIERHNLSDIVIFVVRYFGGIELGAGGLLRAYVKSANECLKMNNIINRK